MTAPDQNPIDLLTDLRLLPLRVSARALDPIYLPDHAGSSLRGAFGDALRRLVCVRSTVGDCSDCEAVGCLFPGLFAPRAAAGQQGTTGFKDLPRSYVIQSENQTAIGVGDSLTWSVTLVGTAIEQLSYFVMGWRGMGESGVGRGRGRFQIDRIHELDGDGQMANPIYDRETNRLLPPSGVLGGKDFAAWGEAAIEAGAGERLSVSFVTPTSLKSGGRPAAVPDFRLFWRSVQLRLSLLRLAHGAGRPDLDFAASLRAAEAVRLEKWEASRVVWQRYSQRQGRRIPMQGFLGRAEYAGELRPFLAALKAGTLVGIGDNCTFGQGVYRIGDPP